MVLTALNRLMKSMRLDGALQRVIKYVIALAGENPKDILDLWQKEATKDTLEFVKKNMPTCRSFENRYQLLDYSLSRVGGKGGLFLEFGVYQGQSLNFIAERVEGKVYGFDSFEGLPSDWIPNCPEGTFRLALLPKVRGNAELVKGWFSKTLPQFMREHPGKCSFLHLDSDIYASAKDVFRHVGPRIAAGTIIVFDEFFNYPNWQEGECKAFMEFVRERKIQFEYIGFNRCGEQAAVRITKIG